MSEGGRIKALKHFRSAAGDLLHELMDVMESPLDGGSYDRCMSVIEKSPNYCVFATEFLFCFPIFILKKRCTTPVILQSTHNHSLDTVPFSTTCPACVEDQQRQTRIADFQLFPF